jgi:hypothetical protein
MQHSITTNVLSHAIWRVVCAFIVALLAALMLAQKPAEAQSIRVSCDIYATNRVDPIAFAQHLHRQFGNLSTSNSSTADSLYANKATSCNAPWWTNAGWVPVERFEAVPNVIVYYYAPGDQTQIVNIPHGLKLVGKDFPGNSMDEIYYNCGAGPDDASPKQATPPYSCTDNWASFVRFPRCWDGIGVDLYNSDGVTPNVVYGPNPKVCPASHPYKLPEIIELVRHPNTAGVVPNPLQISAGVDSWEDYHHMHGDYFFAAQDEFNNAVDLDGDGRIEHTDGGYSEKSLMNLCLREAPDALEYNDDRCRAGGLLPAHVRAINAYY